MKVFQCCVSGGTREARFYSVCTNLQSTITFAWALSGFIERGGGAESEYLVRNYNYSYIKVLFPIDVEQGLANFISQWLKQGLQKFHLTSKEVSTAF